MKRLETTELQGFTLVPTAWLNELAEEVKTIRQKVEQEKAEDEAEWLTIPEIVKRYKVSRETVAKLIKGGRLEYVRVGRRYRCKVYAGGKFGFL